MVREGILEITSPGLRGRDVCECCGPEHYFSRFDMLHSCQGILEVTGLGLRGYDVCDCLRTDEDRFRYAA